MITAGEILRHPTALLDHLASLAPGRAASERRRQAERIREDAIYQSIAQMQPGQALVLAELGDSAPAISAKRRAREEGLIVRTQKGVTPVWRRTSKGAP